MECRPGPCTAARALGNEATYRLCSSQLAHTCCIGNAVRRRWRRLRCPVRAVAPSRARMTRSPEPQGLARPQSRHYLACHTTSDEKTRDLRGASFEADAPRSFFWGLDQALGELLRITSGALHQDADHIALRNPRDISEPLELLLLLGRKPDGNNFSRSPCHDVRLCHTLAAVNGLLTLGEETTCSSGWHPRFR